MAVEDNATTSKDEGLPYSSLMCRHLQSFPEPDLEVVVGPNKRIYKYHALILASHSDFVDLTLSSPAAVKARENWRVEFPDVSEELWEKAISYLGPLHKEPEIEVVFDLISFYDKYQFHAGKQWCDDIICKYIDVSNMQKYGYYTDEVIQKVQQLAVMSFELNLPKSCEPAVKFAAHRLGKMYIGSEEEILQLLPLVDNDEEVLRRMVWAVRGRHCKGMSVEEMLEVVKDPNFHSECIEIRKRIEESDRWISDGTRRTTTIRAYCESETYCEISNPADGTFEEEAGSEFNYRHAPHNGGALKRVWIKRKGYSDPGNFIYAKIESMDFFGSVWEISMYEKEINAGEEDSDNDNSEGSQEESKQTKRIVLWRWDCGHSSLFPPQHGWKKVAEEESGDTIHLRY